MKILVLNGSPKREKSDTMHITRAFLEGMQEAAPQEIHMIDVIDRHIKYCTGCFVCKMNGGTCIHDDDMRAILDEILESDLLLFSFPLYCYGMPAPLKALLDRTMPLSSMAMRKVGDRYEHVGQSTCPRRPSSPNRGWRWYGRRESNTPKRAGLMKRCLLKSVLP